MYLYVCFINTYEKYVNMVNGIEGVPVNKRVAKIKLTDEQIKQLNPKKIGMNLGTDVFEEIEILCIQKD